MSSIDIVTRLYDLSDLPHLDRLIFSIMGQVDAAPIQLHIMVQRLSFTEVHALRNATRDLRRLNGRVSVTLHNWDYPQPFDLRVPLLNWGLDVAQGQYFMCLETYDQLCPHACAALVSQLCSSGAALALGSIGIQPVWWWGDIILPVTEQQDALSPTPVFAVDRTRVAIRDCVFKNDKPDAEIDEFVSRLTSLYDVGHSQGGILALRQQPLRSLGG